MLLSNRHMVGRRDSIRVQAVQLAISDRDGIFQDPNLISTIRPRNKQYYPTSPLLTNSVL
jgi:hypothetical protein